MWGDHVSARVSLSLCVVRSLSRFHLYIYIYIYIYVYVNRSQAPRNRQSGWCDGIPTTTNASANDSHDSNYYGQKTKISFWKTFSNRD